MLTFLSMSTTTNGVTVRITISEEAFGKYEAQAKAQGKTLEQVLEHQLWRFQEVESTKPIILNDAARRHLDKLLARNLSTGDEIVSAVQRALSFTIDGIEIPASPYLLERLRSRCIGMEFGKFLQTTVKRLLEEYAGLR